MNKDKILSWVFLDAFWEYFDSRAQWQQVLMAALIVIGALTSISSRPVFQHWYWYILSASCMYAIIIRTSQTRDL